MKERSWSELCSVACLKGGDDSTLTLLLFPARRHQKEGRDDTQTSSLFASATGPQGGQEGGSQQNRESHAPVCHSLRWMCFADSVRCSWMQVDSRGFIHADKPARAALFSLFLFARVSSREQESMASVEVSQSLCCCCGPPIENE